MRNVAKELGVEAMSLHHHIVDKEALLAQHDNALGCLRKNGFSTTLAANAFSAIDAYVYGFVLTEVNLPFRPAENAEESATELDLPTEAYPHLMELFTELLAVENYD